jgi:hypothetical protein
MIARTTGNFRPLPALGKNFQKLLARLARTLDTMVSAKAARTVPEWQMRKVQSEVNRHLDLIRVAKQWRRKIRRDDLTAYNGADRLSETAICNFSR